MMQAIQSDNRKREVYAYANDVVVTSIQELREAFNYLVQWAEGSSLQVNIGNS
jgi:hypothetical protein